MDLGLHDRVVLITGASRGLGRACALAFAAEGARLALCARGEADLKAVAAEVTAAGVEAEPLAVDVTAPGAGERIVGRILERWDRLDVVVNNAGAGERRAFVALDDEAWQASVELNLLAAVRLIRAAIPPLRAGGGGAIVNVAAASGKRPRLGQSVSNTTKAALINLTESLAVELAPDGIRVNAVCPGLVLNDRWVGRIAEAAARRAVPPDELAATVARDNVPLGRLGTQMDVAPLVVFLASAVTAGYITGVSVEVDGGLGRGVAIRGLG